MKIEWMREMQLVDWQRALSRVGSRWCRGEAESCVFYQAYCCFLVSLNSIV